MTLTDDFKAFRNKLQRVSQLRAVGAKPRRHRWNTIGRTRRKCAEILTTYVRSIEGSDGAPRYPGAEVLPENIFQMRLVGRVRRWEDAHSWEASATWRGDKVCMMLMSYSTMSEIVKSGRVYPVGNDGEVSA